MIRNLLRLGPFVAKGSGKLLYPSKIIPVTTRSFLRRKFSSEITASWPTEITDFLKGQNITSPTPIQEQSLPKAMNNKDLVGIARTGSGKTLAFVIPAVMKILNQRKLDSDNKKSRSPSCLVLSPTRELATQISDVFRKFNHLGIKSIVLVGGNRREDQVNELMRYAMDVYIATPGRLTDLVESEIADLSQIKYLVLDEADRMLDMGFEPQIRKIVGRLPENRQTLMFSATWPDEIKDLAQEFMGTYEYVAVDSETLKANPNIQQIVKIVEPNRKLSTCVEYIKSQREIGETEPKVLIFTNTKRSADHLVNMLARNRLSAIAMHGDKSQNQRFKALTRFKKGFCNILIATDVAARGLDISDITHVINYDMPKNIEDYIHRIGRTARHDKCGTSFSLFTTNDAKLTKALMKVLKETKQDIPRELPNMSLQRRVPREDFSY